MNNSIKRLSLSDLKPKLIDYLNMITTPLSKPNSYICPNCGGGEKSPCFSVFGADRTRAKCFSCDFLGKSGGSIIDICMALEKVDMQQAIKQLTAIFSGDLIPKQATVKINAPTVQKPLIDNPLTDEAVGFESFFLQAQNDIEQAGEYLKSRGIGISTARRLGVGYDANFRLSDKAPKRPYLLFKTGKSALVARLALSDIPAKAEPYKHLKQGKGGLFNAAALVSGEPVFIVEGAFDALSVAEFRGQAVALNSVNNAGILIDELRSMQKSPPMVFICLDNDTAGIETSKRIETALIGSKVAFMAVNIARGYKDPSERLKADSEAFKASIEYYINYGKGA